MFRVFGHQRVAVLDGGFAAWSAATRPVQRGVVRRDSTGYPVPTLDPTLVRSKEQVEAIIAGEGSVQIADCRPSPRFRGEVDEPRPGLRRGHIPTSRNVPYTELTDPATGLMRSPAALRSLLAEQGLDVAEPIVALCGSGTSACALALAVEVIRESGARAVGAPGGDLRRQLVRVGEDYALMRSPHRRAAAIVAGHFGAIRITARISERASPHPSRCARAIRIG